MRQITKEKPYKINYRLLFFTLYWLISGFFILLIYKGRYDNSFINYTSLRIIAIFFILQFFIVFPYILYKFKKENEKLKEDKKKKEKV